MEPATTDRIQRMIDAEATERFPAGAVPRLVLLHYGDHPVIEPRELYLLVILGQDGPTRDDWTAEHFDRLTDLRAQRLPEVKGFMITTDVRDSAGLPPTAIMNPVGISLLDQEDDEIACGLTRVTAHLGPVDLATLDALITAGIAGSRAEGMRWAMARLREQPAYAQPGDDPSVEPGDLLVRVLIEEAEEAPPLPAWHRDHEAMIRELQRELAEQLPGASRLEFWFGENGCQGRTGLPRDAPVRRKQDLTPADIRLGPVDLEMLDALIIAGSAASREEAVSWILTHLRERPAYARLSERARELDELKAHF